MLRPEEIRDLARRQPFVPFRIHLSDQSYYDVVHHDLIMVGDRSLTIGLPGRRPGIARKTVMVDLANIARIDSNPSPSTAN